MKKVIYSAVIIMVCVVSLGSCKKVYHCHCSYNNKIVFSKDLGAQSESRAQEICNTYDSTIAGEIWNCTTY